jgi:hypothetical protein
MQAGSTCSSIEACRSGAGSTRAASGRPVFFGARPVFAALVALGLSAALVAPPAVAKDNSPPAKALTRAEFGGETASKEVRYIADWVVHSGDNKAQPFAIIDKTAAKLFVFYPEGRMRGAAPVLLGIARGDDSAPGIGERELSDIPPELRTTPAGRFVAAIGRNTSGKDVVWVDYDAAVSMHRVINTNPSERRPHRLATPTPLDNRISYGCINVPVKFFEDVVLPSFEGRNGIVYVLPEVKPLKKVFAAYDVEDAPTALASESRPGVTAGQ